MKRTSSVFVLAVLGLFISALADDSSMNAQFERIGPFGGGVRSLLLNPLNPEWVYLGTSDGQIFKSTDGGASWALLYPGIERRRYVIDTLVQHPSETEHLYAGAWDLRSSGGGLFESRDGGSSWKALPLPESSPAVRDFAICSTQPRYMVAGTLTGAYLSQDGGSTWAVITKPDQIRNVESVAIDPRDPRCLLVGTWRLAYRSTDLGKSWVRVDQGMLYDSDVFSISLDLRNSDVAFASACSGIYRSNTRGRSWTRLRVLPDRFTVRAHVVYIDPTESHRVYAGTTEGLFVSRNDGQAWSRITTPRLIVNAIQVDPRDSRKIFLATENRGVLQSLNGGESWTESNSGFVHRQVSRILPDPEVAGQFFTGILSGGQEGGFYLYDQHSRWTSLTSDVPGARGVLSFLALPGNEGRLAGTAAGIYWQESSGTPWKKLPGPISQMVVTDLAVDTRNNWLLAATERGVFRARPDSRQFETPVIGPVVVPSIASLAVAPNGTWYAATSVGVLQSLDQGANWRSVSSGIPARTAIESIAICPAEERHIYAGTVAGLFETKDGGVSWVRANDGRLGADIPSVIFLDPAGQNVMAADKTFGGVFMSNDGGASWQKIDSPRFASPVRYLAQDPARPSMIYLGTVSDGVYRLMLQREIASQQTPRTHRQDTESGQESQK